LSGNSNFAIFLFGEFAFSPFYEPRKEIRKDITCLVILGLRPEDPAPKSRYILDPRLKCEDDVIYCSLARISNGVILIKLFKHAEFSVESL
jgi:hypothetical protein